MRPAPWDRRSRGIIRGNRTTLSFGLRRQFSDKLLAPAFVFTALVTGCSVHGSSPSVPAMLQTQQLLAATTSSMLYVTNPASQDPGEGSILGFAPNANGNVSPIVRIAGNGTRLGYDSASIAIDKLGRLYSTGTAHFQNDVYIWPPGSNGGTKPLTILSVSCGSISVYPMVLAFDRTGHLWVACSSDSGGELDRIPTTSPSGLRKYYSLFPSVAQDRRYARV